MDTGNEDAPGSPRFQLRLHPLDEPMEAKAGAPSPDAPLPAPAAGIDDKGALRLFRQAARLEPNDADYHYIVGLALARAGRHADAVAAFREAVSLHRADADYFQAYGSALWELGYDGDAADAFREVLRLRPDDPWALNGLGCALARDGRVAEAIALFHEALRTTRDADLSGNLAVALWRTGRRQEAMKAFTTAVARRPRAPHWRRQMARALCALGRHGEAARCLGGIDGYRDDAGVLIELAVALYDAGRFENAERTLQEALRADSRAVAEHPRAREIRTALHLKRLKNELRPPASRWAVWRLLLPVLGLFGRLTLPRSLASGALLLGVAAAAYSGWQVGGPYFMRTLLLDDIAGVAGAPVAEDEDVVDRLRHAVRERGMEDYVKEDSCQVHTRPKWRRIVCRYEVPVELLPGLHRTLRFRIDVERPYLLPQDVPRLGF